MPSEEDDEEEESEGECCEPTQQTDNIELQKFNVAVVE